MYKEKGTIILTALVALGIVVVGAFATYFHSVVLAPIVVMGIAFIIGVLLTNRGNYPYLIEDLEKIFFFITFFVIVISFILLYKPI